MNKNKWYLQLVLPWMVLILITFTFLSPGTLEAAGARKGIQLIVVKDDGGRVKGRLLSFKPDTGKLLIQTLGGGAGETVTLEESVSIWIQKNKGGKQLLKAGLALGLGLLGALTVSDYDYSENLFLTKGAAMIIVGVSGLATGMAIGTLADRSGSRGTGIYKGYREYRVKSASFKGRNKLLKRLKKGAMFR